jgi:tetratricopeptide (TPR) repeat protein
LIVAEGQLNRWSNHPILDAWLLQARGECALIEGRADAAIEIHRRVKELKDRVLGRDNPEAISTASNLAISLTAAGRPAEASALLLEIRGRLARVLGDEHPRLGLIAANEGEAFNADHRPAQAREAFERALGIWRKTSASPAFFGFASTGLGIALLGLDRPGEAIPALEEGLRLGIEGHGDSATLGQARFALARALWTRPDARARALALAREAREDALASTSRLKPAEIDAWLAEVAGRR